MTVRDLLETLSMTGAQAAILEEGGTWRAVQPAKLNREDARRILASEDTGAKHLLSSEIGMLDFCRDHIHAVYRKRGAI